MLKMDASNSERHPVMMQRNRLFGASLVFGLVLLVSSAGQARADVTISLDAGNSGLNPPYTGPYGSITVHWVDSTHADISMTSASQVIGGVTYNYYFVDGSTIGLNTNGTVSVVGGIPGGLTWTQVSGTSTWSDGGSGQIDGWGKFNFSINQKDASTPVSALSFEIEDTSGTWADASSVLTLNNGNSLAAAHIGVFDANNVALNVTGFAAGNGGGDSGPPINTPEPSTLAIAGLGASASWATACGAPKEVT